MLLYKNIRINSKNYYHPIILKRFIKLLYKMKNDYENKGCFLWSNDYELDSIASNKLCINDPTYKKYGFMESHLPTELDLVNNTIISLKILNQSKRAKLFNINIKRLIEHDKKGYKVPKNEYIHALKFQIERGYKMYYKYHESYELSFIKSGERILKNI